MAKESADQLRRTSSAIRVSLPAAVAYNLESFQKGIASVVKQLGCPACCSGRDLTFVMERELILNEALGLRASDAALKQGNGAHQTLPQSVTVALPAQVAGNLKQIQDVVAQIAGRLGCAPCCSGFDILFREELAFVVDRNAKVYAAGEGM